MTSSSLRLRGLTVAAVWVGCAVQMPAQAALGEMRSLPAASAPASTGAQRSVAAMARYTVQEDLRPDGSRVREYLAPDGRVFAVSWNTLYKPNLSVMLGQSFPTYATAAQQAALRGGIQRQFRHDNSELVVVSTGHLNVFSGHAYLRSLWPQGLSPQALGWE